MADEQKSHHEHHEAVHHEHHDAVHHEHHEAAHGASGLMSDIPKVDFKKVSGESLKSGFSDVIEILKLNKSRINAVAGRESEGIGIALVYLIIGAIAAPLGSAIIGYYLLGVRITASWTSTLVGAIVAVVVAAVTLYITNLVAIRLFKGKGKFPQFFRVMGYAYLLNVVGFLTMIPFLGSLAGIYMLVIAFIALQEIHKLDTTNAILTILVTIGVFLVLGYLLAMFGLSSGMMGFGSFGSIGPGSSKMTLSY
jgi:hypothetical protein